MTLSESRSSTENGGDDRLGPAHPAYASYFPQYGSHEIEARGTCLPAHMATHLTPHNIVAYSQIFGWEWFLDFLKDDWKLQRSQLLEVLEAVGIAATILRGLDRVPREIFAPVEYRPFSYINSSIPIATDSSLGAPSIVALIHQGLPTEGALGLEVGLGSGYQAALVLQISPATRLIAYEPNLHLCRKAANNLAAMGLSVDIKCKPVQESSGFRSDFEFVYQTVLTGNGALSRIVESVTSASYVFPRILTAVEYAWRMPNSPLLRSFGDYESYVKQSGGRASVLIRGSAADGTLYEHDKLYGVSFSAWRPSVHNGQDLQASEGLLSLCDALKQACLT